MRIHSPDPLYAFWKGCGVAVAQAGGDQGTRVQISYYKLYMQCQRRQPTLGTVRGIIRTMHLMMERMKLLIEPSAAVPLAALMESDLDVSGLHVGIILSGGNLDLSRIPVADEICDH